ncbi:TrmH family RNA methyltransferase, partial [Candidatus Saccharibacteria bacterium]|nr:TrmH family RNA methyltransferase [Candidatus Saccharibacteria bacterium]
VVKIILSGYTAYPLIPNDPRLPHIAEKLNAQIHKTALDAEMLVPFEYIEFPPLTSLKDAGYRIVGLEQADRSIELQNYTAPTKIALLIGEEVNGIEQSLLDQCEDIIEIPMVGQKESFNVSVATGIALYGLSI